MTKRLRTDLPIPHNFMIFLDESKLPNFQKCGGIFLPPPIHPMVKPLLSSIIYKMSNRKKLIPVTNFLV